MDQIPTDDTPSPFHEGEQELQRRVNMRDAVEATGRRIVRPFMPDQHRAFFEQLPFIVLGSVDSQGWPWASILVGASGFVRSPTTTRLDIDARPSHLDPVSDGIAVGNPIGILGIEMPTRRRNRMNARVIASEGAGFSLGVDQSFGNCPQYIQTRDIDMIRDPKSIIDQAQPDRFQHLDAAARAFISKSDTFFVASYIEAKDNPVIEGVDVSHRGGRPGFVKVDGNTLTIPDFPGNKIFNTLGNFLLNPKAGLVFPDFETGDMLFLTGTVVLLDHDDPSVAAFHGAERAWRFHLDHGIRMHDALPFRATFGAFSDNSLLAGTWQEAEARHKEEKARATWRPFHVARIEDESSTIKSFYFEPQVGGATLPFLPGQFLSLRAGPQGQEPLVRTYTVSSSPGEVGYRISVKREEQGAMSRYLHDTLTQGDVVEIKAPQGAFHLDAALKRPAVLLAGGVGITPMMAMARHVITESKRTRHLRPLHIFHAAQSTLQRAFGDTLRALSRESGGKITYRSFISRPAGNEVEGDDFDVAGRITVDLLRQSLPLDDYDFYLCGPPGFMQSTYDMVRSLGARDSRIFAEGFGPATLTRRPDAGQVAKKPHEADSSRIEFVKSGMEHQWRAGDATLLETAEQLGLAPAFSCRTGQCGSCAVKKVSGEVAYRQDTSAAHADDEVLLCCAVPAKGTDTLRLDI